MSYQRPVTRRAVKLGNAIGGSSLQFTAVSHWMMQSVSGIGRWHMVPNGIRLADYPLVSSSRPEAPLVFLGRVEAIKGPHLAIEVALRTGLPLVIAGNVPHEHQSWFDAFISPHLGRSITYMGPIDDVQKAQLLGSARALLMPILWDEPFGIVMAEAMACGTPVLGFDRGAVSEVVEHGVSGFVVKDLDALVMSVGRLGELDRSEVRRRVEVHYSEVAVVDGYLEVYRQMIQASARSKTLHR
jgi:glycosyltransferase involved in cell wall biosynthesis